MGSAASCCWSYPELPKLVGEDRPQKFIDGENLDTPLTYTASFETENPTFQKVSDASAFAQKLKDGVTVDVLLQDGSKLECLLTLDEMAKTITVNCNNKVRVISHDDIKDILRGRDQLKRVETKANLVDDPNCIALHLKKSGNCIPLRFKKVEDRDNFFEVLRNAKMV